MPETVGYDRNGKIRTSLSKDMQERLTSANTRLLRGQEYRRHIRESAWMDSYIQYMGNEWARDPSDPTADVINVNMSFSTINTLVPFTADENPSFVVEPLSGDASPEFAALQESYLNRLWQSPVVQGTVHLREGSFDNLLYGDGFVQVGYEIVDKKQYTELGDQIPSRIKVANFMVERVNPWDIWLDPFSDGIYNARWVARRINLPRRELENDKRYKTPKDMSLGTLDSDNQAPEDRERLDLMEDWVTIYEFYDTVENYMIAFIDGGETVVRYIEGIRCPIVQIPNYRIPNCPYHMGELEQIASLQVELNKTRSQMITHRRRNASKWIVRENALSEGAEEAMKSGITNDVIHVQGNDPFDMLLHQVTATPLTADIYQIDAQIRNDINEVTGVNEYLRGVPQNISRTATEATIIEGATNIRTRHKLLQIETAARQLGQLLLDIIRDVIPLTNAEEMRMYITGREAERLNRATGQQDVNTDVLLTPTSEMFQGEYQVLVERGSTELRNPQIKANKLGQIAAMMLQAMPILLQFQIPFNLKRLLEMWFEAEGIDDVESLFEFTNEDQSMVAQLEMMRQMNAAMQGAEQQQEGAQSAGGAGRTQPGEPRSQTTGAPAAPIGPGNSGMLPPSGY